MGEELKQRSVSNVGLRLAEPPFERRTSAGWMADYDRTQKLMAADLKLCGGVWPVLAGGYLGGGSDD